MQRKYQIQPQHRRMMDAHDRQPMPIAPPPRPSHPSGVGQAAHVAARLAALAGNAVGAPSFIRYIQGNPKPSDYATIATLGLAAKMRPAAAAARPAALPAFYAIRNAAGSLVGFAPRVGGMPGGAKGLKGLLDMTKFPGMLIQGGIGATFDQPARNLGERIKRREERMLRPRGGR